MRILLNFIKNFKIHNELFRIFLEFLKKFNLM